MQNLSIGEILTFLGGIAGAVFIFWVNTKERLRVLEVENKNAKDQREEIISRIDNIKEEITERFNTLENRLFEAVKKNSL